MQRISITNPQNIIDGTAKKYYFKLRNTGGPKGDKGDKGDTGATGPQGPQGNTATVSVGSTTTLPVGYDATVTNTGSIYNAVLDFGIPQGPQGPQGAKGDKGDTGAKGDTGPRGPQGEKGTNATVYVGTTTTTNPGTQARVYNSGTDSNAVLNFEIPRGDVGPMPTIAQATGQSTTEVMSQKATTDALNTKQATITNSNKLSADLVTDTTTTNKFVTAEDKTTWNAKQNALTAGQGIDITSDVISTPALVPEVVASLPAEGTEGKLYLTPKAHTTSTATGNPVTASVTEQAGQMESFQLDGDTFQQSYEGKNLLNYNTIGQTTLNGVTLSLANDGTITLDGTCSADNTRFGFDNLSMALDGTYTLSFEVVSGTIANATDATEIRLFKSGYSGGLRVDLANTSASSTLSVSGDYILNDIRIDNGVVLTNYKIKVQLEKSDTATSFEPYVGGTPSPNPDYPQPIQTVTGEQTVTIVGKNLLNVKDNLKTSASGLDFSFSDNKLVVSGTPTATYANVTDKIDVDLPAGDYTLSISNTVNHRVYLYVDYEDSTTGSLCVVNAGSTSRTATFAKRAVKIRLDFSYMTTGTALNESFAIQLEAGSTATTYEPYSSNDYEINLGKNLFDKSSGNILAGYVPGSTIVAQEINRVVWIKCEPNTTYTISTRAESWSREVFTTEIVPAVGVAVTKLGKIGSGESSFTVQTGATAQFLAIRIWQQFLSGISLEAELGYLQIELGNQATAYAPYFTPIELCKIVDYQDYIYKDGDNWKVHKATNKITLNGSEAWYNAAGNAPFGLVINGALITTSDDNPPLVYCDKFYPVSQNASWSSYESLISTNNTGSSTKTIRIRYTAMANLSAFQTWLGGNNATLYYVLATATDTVITDQTLIAQLEAIRTASLENGTNTITNSTPAPNLAGDMEIGYYGYNPRNRYDKWLWLDINNNYEQLGS